VPFGFTPLADDLLRCVPILSHTLLRLPTVPPLAFAVEFRYPADFVLVQPVGADTMWNNKGNVFGKFGQPKLIKPRKVWLLGGCYTAVWVVLLWFAFGRGVNIRYTLPVSVGLIIVVNVAIVCVFLRWQQRTLDLVKSPRYSSRLGAMLFRTFLPLVPYFVMMWLQGNKWLAFSFPLLFGFAMFAVGASIAAAGFARRIGDEDRCAGCGYVCGTSGDRCSECGRHWRESGGLIRGHRVVQPAAIVVGALVVIVGGAGIFPSRYSIDRLGLYLMPDSVRVRVATTGATWSSEGKLKDLLAGQLSPENELLLAESLLDQRIQEGRFPASGAVWLEGKLLAGGLTPAIRERFFEEMFEIWLEGPDEVVAGELFAPLIASRNRVQSLGSTIDMRIFLGGVSTDGGKTFSGRGNHVLGPASASNVWYHGSMRFVQDQTRNSFIPRVLINTPGEHEIVVRMWIAAVVRPVKTFSAKWNDDGTPVLPPGALWTKEVLLRRAVVVEEK
jgi:hypothetical protein